ncbi:MAG: hypothetical protein MJH08_19420, partial [Hyphomicrobiales bacterium]|nr:hypothetical protein [Hyphomicrobiales bacterium]
AKRQGFPGGLLEREILLGKMERVKGIEPSYSAWKAKKNSTFSECVGHFSTLRSLILGELSSGRSLK